MATTDKDFVVKNGLVVQGNQGTINNSVIITEATTNNVYPSQTGNTGKYLKTNGTNVEWATVSGGSSNIVVTDEYTDGDTIYIGDTTPTSPTTGDIWIDESSVTGSITWGQLKALEGIASGG